jgi:hypothetical protein
MADMDLILTRGVVGLGDKDDPVTVDAERGRNLIALGLAEELDDIPESKSKADLRTWAAERGFDIAGLPETATKAQIVEAIKAAREQAPQTVE